LLVGLSFLLLVACGGTSGTPAPAASASGPPEKGTLKVGVGGQGQIIYMPLTLGNQLGYFKDEGITVDIQNFNGGSAALDALVGGSVDVVTGFYEHTIRTQTKGKFIEMITVFDDYPGLVMEVGKKHQDQVRSIKDLVGHPVGVTALGSSTDEMVKFLQKQAGLNTDSVPTVAAGTGAASIAQLRSDAVWALVTVEPTASIIEKNGDGKPIYDTRTPEGTKTVFGGSWPAGGFYLYNDFVKANPHTAQALARVGVRTLKYIKTHSATDIASRLPAQLFYADGNKDFFVQVLEASLKMFSPDGTMPADGPPNVLNTLKAADTKTDWSTVDLKKTYDNSFVKNVKT
jgi:NitT/TauT family transport system substrate-binding protein